jgi:hypothetical protein
MWRFFPGANETFLFNMQSVRYSIDIVEVGYHLCRIVNGAIVKAVPAKSVDIIFTHLSWRVCQLNGVGTESLISIY